MLPKIRADLRPRSGQDMLRNPPGQPTQAEFLPLQGAPGPPTVLGAAPSQPGVGPPAVPGGSSAPQEQTARPLFSDSVGSIAGPAGRPERVRKAPLRFSPSSAGRPRKKARAPVASQEEAAFEQAVAEQAPDPSAAEEPETFDPSEADADAVLENKGAQGQAAATFSTGGIPRLCCPFRSKSWASRAGLLHHVEACHLSAGQTPPEQFLLDAARRVC